MVINGVEIESTYAEAFSMKATRIIVTARTLRWAYRAASAVTGFATSIVGCGCEAGIEKVLIPAETPDKRPGISILLFALGSKNLTKQVTLRVSQCVLTTPTAALFSGIDSDKTIPLGNYLRFFGDGFQISKLIQNHRYWRIPTMEGEFFTEETTGIVSAIGGGNFLVFAKSQSQILAACEAAVSAIKKLPNVITPFPGGMTSSGSKVGSKYKMLKASTNTVFCPTLRGQVATKLTYETESVMEIIIDGLSKEDISKAMKVGISTICSFGEKNGIVKISAGNYGGRLGSFHFHLHEVIA
ncbi:formylmethanofuran--tetrahydromethanopterin N-formyltransferase [Candidatus Nitrosacidococcus tergens]|uniref:Formylmethanofuran--tetrahydromethanopterin formyltransferase n=1 Tax=Candidatus Nitrosacidococcus tergens TaxID=553981 RepID=A0A7G1Q6X3_9GAMM|nr:formylmethanofuran--tetrahydromethanopterin N-formyltransferase [Candidatus Nitrosacidococcus tergens]CAB1274107.1 Formylmethanofuran--tetrahydromethanopterin formyltransferase [Candidatus Nitrosacidococcus tergens]